MSSPHHEIEFETYLTQQLIENGWREGHSDQYDAERALYPEDLIGWVQDSQPQQWDKLTRLHGSGAATALLDAVVKKLEHKTGGTVDVIRNGVSIPGLANVKLSEAAPEDDNNPELMARYRLNRLRVVRQLKYCPTRAWAIDVVLFINGLPVATLELKTDFTQSVEDAIVQYQTDRLPVDPQSKRKQPLLTFKRGAVVHFAMSDSLIYMTTELKGERTLFLPFNQGHHGHAGNAPRTDGEYPVAYFWQEVATWANWLRLFHNFVFVQKENKVDKFGIPFKKETLIFPRYHQMAAVNRMIADVKTFGPGQSYLNEHSAGSGKTNTIAWTAHDLIQLRYPNGEAYFNSVLIVTDRTVLDAQLQDAVSQIDHQFGVITNIARQKGEASKSQQLAQALLSGSPIIVVTIQTFPYAMEAILTEQSLKSRRFAVIIDEAHTSQTGSTAQGLRAVLSLEASVELEKMTVDDLLLEIQKSRVRPDNVSYFAFTATPKHSTFMLFGRPKNPLEPVSDDNPPQAFSRYPQRQAIEEGFILDVLQNYTPYSEAYRLSSDVMHDTRVDQKLAKRALAKWKALHPTHVSHKVEFIVQHFQQTVQPLLEGEAKAMVVTSGRPQAVKYKLAFDRYIQQHQLQGIQALVAFSGKVKGELLGEDDAEHPLDIDPDYEYSEANLNPQTQGQDLRHVFDQEAFNVMIVANKFQTGFNQPKLVAMYLDKKLSGVEAVQTLSRLNRTYPGKNTTYVIDFVNEPQTILEAFKQYDDGAQIDSVQDLNVVYEIKALLDEAAIYYAPDLAAFKQARAHYLMGHHHGKSVHKKLYAATQPPTDRYNVRLRELSDAIRQWETAFDRAKSESNPKAMQQAEAQRSELSQQREALKLFKSQLGKFVRVYHYIAQLIELGDAELENFAAFAQLLARRLDGIPVEHIDLTGIAMTYYAIQRRETGTKVDEAQPLYGISAGADTARDREKEFLSEIIQRLNTLFGDLSDSDNQKQFTDHIVNITQKQDVIREQIEKNTKQQALNGDLPQAVNRAIVTAMTSHGELARVLLKDPQSMAEFVSVVYDLVKVGAEVRVD